MEKTDQKYQIMSPHLNIRSVEKADLRALEWDGEYKRYRRMYADIFDSTLVGKTLMWLVEKEEGEIIGQAFVMLKSSALETDAGKRRAYIFGFRIRDVWRNRGIGSYLMRFVEGDLAERGFHYITLNVAKKNDDALRLYQRLGYKILGSNAGKWSYVDDQGVIQHVNEPSWRMIKRIGEKI
jgi:ribosomal protein S18 acetylase RimI-like enzyme